MADVYYTVPRDTTMQDIARELTGYAEYAGPIADHNNLDVAPVGAGVTLAIPQEWLKENAPVSATITGGKRDWTWVFLTGLAIMLASGA